eukprot:713985-Rhodomonas_salina.2
MKLPPISPSGFVYSDSADGETPSNAAGRRAPCLRAARRTRSAQSKPTPRPGPVSSQGRCSGDAEDWD